MQKGRKRERTQEREGMTGEISECRLEIEQEMF